MTVKILITTDWYEPVVNGVVTSVLNLVKELRKKGHQVRVLTLSNDTHSRYNDQVYYIGSINAGTIYPNARATLYVGRDYINDIVRWHPDIIHSQCEFSSFQYAKRISRRLNIPIIHTYHTLYESYTHYFCPNKTMGKHIVSKLSHHFLSQVQCVIAPSEKIRRVLDNYRILRRICVVPSGIELDKFDITLSEAERAALKADIGIPPQNKVLLTLGRLAKEKNIEQIIDYISLMKRDDISFVVVGGGPYKKVLTDYVEKYGLKDKVFFTGMIVPQLVPKYYLLADVFLCASTSEAQGLTYMEAMASGIPSVCHKDLCIKNIIIDGYNGYQYTNFLGFETAVNKVLDDPQLHAELSRNAKELMEKEFSTQAFADKIEAIYFSEIERYK